MAQNSTASTLFSGTDAADTLQNWGASVTIDAGAGDDKIYNEGTNVSISAGAGNDSVLNQPAALGATINTGSGNDTVTIWSTDTTTLQLGAGSNVIMITDDTGIVLNAVLPFRQLRTSGILAWLLRFPRHRAASVFGHKKSPRAIAGGSRTHFH